MWYLFPLSLDGVISAALIGLGLFYIAAPKRVLGSFGINPPATDANTLVWLHVKGIRDVACGSTVLILMLTTNSRTVGILFLVLAAIPFGDISNVLISGGRKATAFFVDGLTCLLMLSAGLLLIRVF